MGSRRSRWASLSMNALLFVLGVVVIVLAYSLVTRAFAPRADPARERDSGELVGDIIQVEVRNGCGVSGVAAETTLYLRRMGFDVVEVGDFSNFNEAHSKVIDRVGDLASARKVAAALGIPESRVEQEIRPDYFLDASVILGKDYDALRPFAGDGSRSFGAR